MEPITFRPTRSTAAFYSAIFLLPAAILAGLLLSDPFALESVALAILTCPLLAVLGVYCGAGLLCLRIVADNVGLRRAPWWFDGCRIRWVDVMAWSVRPLDPIDAPEGCQVLELLVRDRLLKVRILDYEVAQPGFSILVEFVSTRHRAREGPTPPSADEPEPNPAPHRILEKGAAP